MIERPTIKQFRELGIKSLGDQVHIYQRSWNYDYNSIKYE